MNRKTLSRRQALSALSAAGAAVIAAACSESPTSPTAVTETTGSTGTTTTSTNTACVITPTETAGPYPSLTDFFRSDIREDRQGTPLTLTVKVVNTNSGCAPVTGANVEIWHCDSVGNYSQYGTTRSATYLRGIQTTNGNGEVTFTTIYPGWYQGRATHIHLEVTQNGVSRKITQMAFPESINDSVHMTGVYASHGTNPTANAADGIFADSLSSELVTPVGDPSSGYAATFQVAIAV
ncbi:MAG: intradiol ring-cleavage dioxygenase [Vicinamibacterales bacterium]